MCELLSNGVVGQAYRWIEDSRDGQTAKRLAKLDDPFKVTTALALSPLPCPGLHYAMHLCFIVMYRATLQCIEDCTVDPAIISGQYMHAQR